MISRFANVIGSTPEIEELFSFYSDFYKDIYGIRPRGLFADQRYNAEWLKEAITYLKTTPEYCGFITSREFRSEFDALCPTE